ncbi:MAG: hypothetical protein HGB35_04115 [Geobacteraceae bacterium]|nr:hypothetical protein [Geobacteraceae bacterium]
MASLPQQRTALHFQQEQEPEEEEKPGKNGTGGKKGGETDGKTGKKDKKGKSDFIVFFGMVPALLSPVNLHGARFSMAVLISPRQKLLLI